MEEEEEEEEEILIDNKFRCFEPVSVQQGLKPVKPGY